MFSLFSGCDRGFGETLASKLALDGYTIYAGCLDVNSDGAKHLANNPNVRVIKIDVTKQSDVDAAARLLNQELWERGSIMASSCHFCTNHKRINPP